MKKFNKSQLVFIIGFIVLFANPNFAICIAQNRSDSLHKNITTDSILQSFIEERINTINEYNSLYYKKEKLIDSIDFFKSKIRVLTQDTIRNLTYLTNFYSQSNIEKQNLVYDSLKLHFTKVLNAENIIESLNKNVKEITFQQRNTQKQIDLKKVKYDSLISEITTKIDTLTRLYEMSYNGKKYLLFFANNIKNKVEIIGNSGSAPSTIKSVLNSSKEVPLMITNGGMYQPSYKPQGLLIANGIKEMEIDSSKGYREGNFYLYPNGIFFIDTANKFHIKNTSTFLKTHYKLRDVKYATQSGPLLIDEGKLNNNISLGSSNYNIRSGVGIINEKKIIFIISEDKVSFYDFKMAFTSLGCKSALYFDGIVSRMYYNDKYPLKSPVLNDYNLGPMIVVYPKK